MSVTVNFRMFDFPSNNVNEQKSVSLTSFEDEGLYEKIAQVLNVSPDHINIFFRGKRIKSSSSLLALDFRDQHFVQVLYHPAKDDKKPSPDINPVFLKKALDAIQVSFHRKSRSQRYKNLIKILTDPKKLQPIIDQVSGLENDIIALDILRNPGVFFHVAHSSHIDRIMSMHRLLAFAIIRIYRASSHDSKTDDNVHDNNPIMSWDHFARLMEGDDEDAEDMDVDPSAPVTSGHSRNQSRPAPLAPSGGFITSNQLAQALSMANSPQSGRIFPSPASNMQSPQTATGSSSSGGSSRGAISSDVFSMAMQQAMTQGATAQPEQQPEAASESQQQQLSAEVMERGLEQLRGMGITDEAASREALQVARGNVETAVNILFSSGLHDL